NRIEERVAGLDPRALTQYSRLRPPPIFGNRTAASARRRLERTILPVVDLAGDLEFPPLLRPERQLVPDLAAVVRVRRLAEGQRRRTLMSVRSGIAEGEGRAVPAR